MHEALQLAAPAPPRTQVGLPRPSAAPHLLLRERALGPALVGAEKALPLAVGHVVVAQSAAAPAPPTPPAVVLGIDQALAQRSEGKGRGREESKGKGRGEGRGRDGLGTGSGGRRLWPPAPPAVLLPEACQTRGVVRQSTGCRWWRQAMLTSGGRRSARCSSSQHSFWAAAWATEPRVGATGPTLQLYSLRTSSAVLADVQNSSSTNMAAPAFSRPCGAETNGEQTPLF